MKLIKQYGDFSSYPYPLLPADQAFVARIAKDAPLSTRRISN